jgi:hypothetical protein
LSLTPFYDNLYVPEEEWNISKKYKEEAFSMYANVTNRDLTRIAMVRREHPLFIELQENILSYQMHLAFEAAYRRMNVIGNICKVLTPDKIDDVINKGKPILDIIQYLLKLEDEAMERYQNFYCTYNLKLDVESVSSGSILSKLNTEIEGQQEYVVGARSLSYSKEPTEL